MANADSQPAQTVNDNITELIESVTEAYLHPPANTSDKNGRMCLYLLADRFSISPIKARKLLITSGAYKTPLSEYIGKLFRNGKTVKEIQNLTGLCAASVSGYLPYRKTVYNLESTTKYVEHLRRYRRRKALTHKLKTSISALDTEHTKDVLWETLTAFAEYPFKTVKGLSFTYTVKGNELFFTRKEKSVTKASVNMAFDTAVRLSKEGTKITGPKMLGCFGASYIYPVFIRIGVICDGEGEMQ